MSNIQGEVIPKQYKGSSNHVSLKWICPYDNIILSSIIKEGWEIS